MTLFSKNLTLIKSKAGLTNKSLASKLDIDDTLMSKLLNGKRKPSNNILTVINTVFNESDAYRLTIANLADKILADGYTYQHIESVKKMLYENN